MRIVEACSTASDQRSHRIFGVDDCLRVRKAAACAVARDPTLAEVPHGGSPGSPADYDAASLRRVRSDSHGVADL